MAGKGDKRRPSNPSEENWELAFRRSDKNKAKMRHSRRQKEKVLDDADTERH